MRLSLWAGDNLLRIVMLSDRIPPENRGGAGVVTWRLAVALKQAGHDVHVVAATADDAFEQERDGIPTYHIHSRYPERWRAYFSLRNPMTVPYIHNLYQRIMPDVVNAHNIHADLSYHALTIARELNIPAVFSSHDAMPFAYHKLSYFIDPTRCGAPSTDAYKLPFAYNLRQMRLRYNPLRNRTIRRILERDAALRTSPSHELARAHQANGLPPFEVVHNGIDPTAFMQNHAVAVARLRERLDLHGRKIILFAGRLTPAKGTRHLLQALARVVRDVPEALLLVLSSVSIDEQLQQPEYEHLKSEHIRVAGWLESDDLIAAYQVASVVVVPSVALDPFPTVNLEAMAAGKAVLATCYGGSAEAVVDAETGYIINPHDTDDFAAKLGRVLQDDALQQRMGAAGRQRVQAYFALGQQVQAMLDVYRRALVSA